MHIQLHDGRKLAYKIYGNPTSTPVLVFHGFPGSHLQCAILETQLPHLCLISFDRPGFGDSDHDPNRTIVSTCDDAKVLMNFLNVPKFSVIGISCGGAYALGMAALFPSSVKNMCLFAGMGPMDLPLLRKNQMAALKLLFGLSRIYPPLIAPLLLLDSLLYRKPKDKVLALLNKMLPAPDVQFFDEEPEIATIFVASLAEAYKSGLSGAILEASIITKARPYTLDEIKTPTIVIQGGLDRNVPKEMGQYIAKKLANSQFYYTADDGHISIFRLAKDICINYF